MCTAPNPSPRRLFPSSFPSPTSSHAIRTDAHAHRVPLQRRRKPNNAHYDLNDPFIDDSDLAIDERSFFAQTKQQGFYVSAGEVALLKEKTPRKPHSRKPLLLPLPPSASASASVSFSASAGASTSASVGPGAGAGGSASVGPSSRRTGTGTPERGQCYRYCCLERMLRHETLMDGTHIQMARATRRSLSRPTARTTRVGTRTRTSTA
jgi:hypothetical protein